VGKEEAKQKVYCDQLREKLAQNAELRYQRDHVVRPKVVAVKGQYDKMMRAISKVRGHKGEKWKEVIEKLKDQMAEEVEEMNEEVFESAKDSKLNLTYLSHAKTILDNPTLRPVAQLNFET
jgi:hypothetical protein